MKKVCMLLNGGVASDSRVKRVIQTISRDHFVDLYYLNGNQTDSQYFNSNVTLFPQRKNDSLKAKLQRHSFFYNEYNYLAQAAINSGRNYDIVYANDLPTLTASNIISNHFGAKLVYDSHEIYTETINQFFDSENRFKNVVFRSLIDLMREVGTRQERKLLRKVDRFITVNTSLADFFQNKYNFRKVNVVMNCPETDRSHTETNNLREIYGLSSDDIVLYYHGMINKGRGLKLMIDAMKELDSHYKFIIVGKGPMLDDLKKQAATLGLSGRIIFHGSVPSETLVSVASGADIGINLLEDLNLSKSMASPNKLFEYIHAGIPVLCSDTLENKKVLNKYKVGTTTKNNVVSIVRSLKELVSLKKQEDFKVAIQNARNEYNWQKQEKVLQQLLAEL